MELNLKDNFGRIGVLMGGPSSEREISLKSGDAVYSALKNRFLDLVGIDILTEDVEENIKLIKSCGINCAFLALHGRFGEDGQIQNILESLNIPYTGSGVKASQLAIDKIASNKIFESAGLFVPRYKETDKANFNAQKKEFLKLGLPLVIKPATHGSSIGLTIINEERDLDKAAEIAFIYDERIIIQEYIQGRELTVGILEERALPAIEIIPKNMFFDFEAKYKSGLTEYIVPAELDQDIAEEIMKAASSAHKLLGCFGCSRVDMILNKNNQPFILEVNTIPGMTSTSLLPKAARTVGIEFPDLCLTLIKLAYEKTKIKSAA
jgi:D-alanine-D-alanine ligase